MNETSPVSLVREYMLEFARSTGLSPAGASPRRYLWTDAFAVCNFLELFSQTGEDEYKNLALELVDQVHGVLGRHREDDERSGWISGLDEQEGERHPTIGGLRIGKKLNERSQSDRFDERLEWDRDGQYYHYLTKWMHALSRAGQAAGRESYTVWAVELAKTAHARFTCAPTSGGRKRMYWKMSIDLSRPLVESMGQHDPLDGFITYNQLQISKPREPGNTAYPDLGEEITDMAGILAGQSWVTDDPLGIGGLLCDALRTAQMIAKGYFERYDLLESVLGSVLPGLEYFSRTDSLQSPAEYRLAFRELGLSIGLHAVERLRDMLRENHGLFGEKAAVRRYIETLTGYTGLIEVIEDFWLEPSSREASSWIDHRDINMVMLATSLAPDGFLRI